MRAKEFVKEATAVAATEKKPGLIRRVGNNLLLPAAIAYSIYEAVQEIRAIPTNIDKTTYRAQVAKIVSREVAQWGLMAVMSVFGTYLGGFAGPQGAVAGGIAGGLASIPITLIYGDTIDSGVDRIVDQLYSNPGSRPVAQGTDSGRTAVAEIPADEIPWTYIGVQPTRYTGYTLRKDNRLPGASPWQAQSPMNPKNVYTVTDPNYQMKIEALYQMTPQERRALVAREQDSRDISKGRPPAR